VNNDWENVWKEAIVISFKVLSQHMAGESDENHKNLSQAYQFPVEDLKQGCPENDEGVPHFGVILNPLSPSTPSICIA
jgi:hypothetical protein